MALYGKQPLTATLSDGSVISFVRPRNSHVGRAQAVWMKENMDRIDEMRADLTDAQRAELERQRTDRDRRPAAAPVKQSFVEQCWAQFALCDHATLVGACFRSWRLGSDDMVWNADEPADLSDVPLTLLEEAARAMFEARVGAPEAARGN